MIIIIEGPDGSGKSTLANKLKEQTGYTLLHSSYPRTEEDKKLMFARYVDVIKSNKNCILDRSWYSEMVYGPVMRGNSVISYSQMYELEALLAKRGGAIVINCTAPTKVLWKRCQKRGEDYVVDIKTLEKICEGYTEVLSGVPHFIPVVRCEYTYM